MDPIFLTLAEVLLIHRDQIERYGGAPGIRDLALLESAIAIPAAGVGNQYAHEDISEMAVAYLYHIVRNHPFVDGNKRTGLVAALVFLSLNGVELEADEHELEQLVWNISKGKATKQTATLFFRSHLPPAPKT